MQKGSVLCETNLARKKSELFDCFNTYQVHMFDIAQEKRSDIVSVVTWRV